MLDVVVYPRGVCTYTKILDNLLDWMSDEGYYSYDWYDPQRIRALSWLSELGKPTRFVISRTTRYAPEIFLPFTSKLQSATAMGLLSSVYFNLYKKYKKQYDLEKGEMAIEWLINDSFPEDGWGLPFTWRMPEGVVAKPKTGMTTIMPYIMEGFEDAYQVTKDESYLDIIKRTRHFFVEKLNYSSIDEDRITSSYTPLDNFRVINASSYTANGLMRIYKITKEKGLKSKADKLINYVRSMQNEEGSWGYWEGEISSIDSLHQCYIIENLYGCGVSKQKLSTALEYFLSTFISSKKTVRKFPNKDYSELIDNAEAYIMGNTLGVETINIEDIIENFGIKKKPYFKSSIGRTRENKIPYIRWGQSQMAYALMKEVVKLR